MDKKGVNTCQVFTPFLLKILGYLFGNQSFVDFVPLSIFTFFNAKTLD
jgi:hypothetical protein